MFGEDWGFLKDNENLSEIEPMVIDLVQDMTLSFQLEDASGPVLEDYVSKDEPLVNPNPVGVGLDGSDLDPNKEAKDLVDDLFQNTVEFPVSGSILNNEEKQDDGSNPNKAQEDPEEPDVNVDDILLDCPIEDREGVQADEVNQNKVEVPIEVEDFILFEEENQRDELGLNKREVEPNKPNPNEADLKSGEPIKYKAEVETDGWFQVEVESDSEKIVSNEAAFKPNKVPNPNNAEVQSSGPTCLEAKVEQDGSSPNEIKSQVDGPNPNVTKGQVNGPTLTEAEVNADLHVTEKVTTQAYLPITNKVSTQADVPFTIEVTTQAHPLVTKEVTTLAIVPVMEEVAAEAILLMSNEAQVDLDGPERHTKRKSNEIRVQQDEPKRRRPRQVDLPLGWTMEPKKRLNNGKTNGVVDKTYFSPSGKKFRSWKKAKAFINGQNQEVNNEEPTPVVNPEVPDAIANVEEMDN